MLGNLLRAIDDALINTFDVHENIMIFLIKIRTTDFQTLSMTC